MAPGRALLAVTVAALAACTPDSQRVTVSSRAPDSAPSTKPSAAPSSAPLDTCLAADSPRLTKSMREDLDGDGKPDWIVSGSYTVELFVDRNGCAESRGSFQTEGPLAFVHVGPVGSVGAMRILFVETWLHHGDRAQYVYTWTGNAYAKTKRERDIIEGTPP